jgi:limonene-1,2-epoxide hydrolase
MADARQIIEEFCAAVGRKDLAGCEELLDEAVVYHNVGSDPAVGREATVAALKFQFDMFEPIAFVIRNLAVDGDTVLTERVDEVTANGIMAPVPVMGAFEVRNGAIVAWRDYFDMGLTGRLMAGDDVGAHLPA